MKLVVDKESLVSVADAIREKGGTSESLEFPQGFVDAVGAIESGGGGDTFRAFLTNTLTEYTINDEIDLINVRFNRKKLIKFVAPNMISVDGYTFYGCSDMAYIDFGVISSLNPLIFNGLHKIETVILRKADGLVTLTGTFMNSSSILNPDYKYQCYFYVPKALIEDYKVATNWSNYANRFRAIEDYPEIIGGAL